MSSPAERDDLVMLLMRAASATAERINAEVVAAGYPGLRPAHGLVFVCTSRGGATVSQIGAALGVTKQSAAAIVEELVDAGYLTRATHPGDRRAHLLTLTPRGWGATRAATRAARRQWRDLADRLGPERLSAVADALDVIGADGTLRPVW
jgi:DNA-binding MarR family transcriptional regulator